MVVVVLVVVVVVRTRHTALTHQLRILPLRQASPDRGKYLINASYCGAWWPSGARGALGARVSPFGDKPRYGG